MKVLPFIFICQSVSDCIKYCCRSFPVPLSSHHSLPLAAARTECNLSDWILQQQLTSTFGKSAQQHPWGAQRGLLGGSPLREAKSWTLILCTCPCFTFTDVWAPQALVGTVEWSTPKGCPSQEDPLLGTALPGASSFSFSLFRALGWSLFSQFCLQFHLWPFDFVYTQGILIPLAFLYSREIVIHIPGCLSHYL